MLTDRRRVDVVNGRGWLMPTRKSLPTVDRSSMGSAAVSTLPMPYSTPPSRTSYSYGHRASWP